jgi:hypothetical protein
MPEIAIFCEDSFHEVYSSALVKRFASEVQLTVNVRVYSATGGLSKMHYEFGMFMADIQRNTVRMPDLLIVILDANCIGYVERKKLIDAVVAKYPQLAHLVIVGIPDPHIERWMLVDPDAFRQVFDCGCTLPAVKCEKDLYKKLLRKEISNSGIVPALGGQEYAEDIVERLSIGKINAENSLRLFVRDLRGQLKQIKQR